MIVQDKIITKWNVNNRKYYESLGYHFTNVGDEFEINTCDLLKSSPLKVKVACDCCGKLLEISYTKIHRQMEWYGNYFCAQCSKLRNLDAKRDRYYSELIRVCDEHGYTVLTPKEDIYNQQTNISYICPKHGIQTKRLSGLLNGSRCYACSREVAAIKQSQTTLPRRQELLYNKAIKAAEAKGYKLLSAKEDIVNNITYIQYECPKHGVMNMRVSNFINGKGCPKCVSEENSKRFRMSVERVEEDFAQYGGKLLNASEYVNSQTKNLKVVCPSCGEVFLTSYRSFTQRCGQQCPKCAKIESYGEMLIRKYLEENGYIFEKEKWWSDCRCVKPLPFDFYLPDLRMIIEFDGAHHREPKYGMQRLLRGIRHDTIKDNYCVNNNILLCRFSSMDIANLIQNLDTAIKKREQYIKSLN